MEGGAGGYESEKGALPEPIAEIGVGEPAAKQTANDTGNSPTEN